MNANQEVKISIITPVLNAEKYIERNLISLANQLKANDRNLFEHIIVDGGSKDRTEEIILKYKEIYNIVYIKVKDNSLFEGIWNGYKISKGEYIGTIFADDIYLPWTIEVVNSIFKQHTDVNWITGIPSWLLDGENLNTITLCAPIYSRSLMKWGFYSSGKLGFLQQESMFWRKELWKKNENNIEKLFKNYKYAADYHLWKLFAQNDELKTVSTVLSSFSLSNNQMSSKFKEKYIEECGIKAKNFEISSVARLFNRAYSLIMQRKILRVFNPNVR